MKRHKLLRAVVAVAILSAGAGAIIRSSIFGTPAQLTSRAGAALDAGWRWARIAATHVTTTQLVEAAALAWLLFVLSLIWLARSRPTEARAQEPQVDVSNAATVPDATRRHQAQVAEAVSRAVAPPLPVRPAPHDEYHAEYHAEYDELSDDWGSSSRMSHTHPIGSLAEAAAAPQLVVEPRHMLGKQAANGVWKHDGRAVDQSRGRVLALTGVSLSRERLLRYGLFIVAEDTGGARTGGEASRRVIEVIADQIASSLVSDAALGSVQFAALLKMAMIRASIDLRQQSARTSTDLGAVVAGALVIGAVAHIVNVGACRTYIYQPRDGLVQLTTDHGAMSRLVENGLLTPKSLHAHPRRDQLYLGGEDAQTSADMDTFAVNVHSDDLLLLCSPGLWQAVRKPRIEAILRAATDSRDAAELLAREGMGQTGAQDFSAIVVRPLGEWMAEFGIAASSACVS